MIHILNRQKKTGQKVLRGVCSILTAPPVVGAAYVLGLAAWAGQRSDQDDTDLGGVARADAMTTFIEHRFGAEIGRMRIGIIATAMALGLTIGILADILLRLRLSQARRARRSFVRAFADSAVMCALLHALLVLWAMAKSPQLYATRWYGQGGLARTVQVLATDVLGPNGILVVSCVLVGLCVKRDRVVMALRVARRLSMNRVRDLARRIGGRTAILLLIIGLAAAALRSRESVAASSSARPLLPSKDLPNVLILAADSLRADRLDPRIAPNLTALAARATRFDRAYVSLPRTFPSWVTILTGRHGHHHGIRSMFPTWDERAKDFDALPERLARAGFRTGVVSDYAGDIFGRIDLGFQRVDTPSFDFRQLIRQRALERETPLMPLLHSQLGRKLFPVMRELNAAADPMLLEKDVEAALDAFTSGKNPFFLTVFFSTAHFPYAAPAPYYAKYTDSAYRGRFKYHKPVGLGHESEPDEADVRQIRALYDGAVTAIDDAVACVISSLERRGLAENTIIVVTADHGEALFDHGHGQGHGDHLFGDEVTHVPLVIYDPRAAAAASKGGGRREASIVRDVDIAATLYELTGVEPPRDLDGQSLAAALRGEPVDRRFAYAETELWFTEDIPGLKPELRIPYPGIMALTELDTKHNAEIVLRRDMAPITQMARHRMIRDERFKLVYMPTRQGAKYMLFDTKEDPGETRDVSGEKPGEAMRLRAELWAWMLKDPEMEQKDGLLVPSLAMLTHATRTDLR
ncbi:MAG: sulfatase-like hydrolase/transferase [Polyangiaceae bacterium]|nr:sulfatase-like hydrolase/transferase [Polyangiaceae bacterium]